MSITHDIYLETSAKKVFAAAVEWPGWCRSGRDEASAIQALFQAGPRYAQVLASTALAFQAPGSPADLHIIERVAGNTTTDFGSPDVAIASDRDPIDVVEMECFQTLLKACWLAFDQAVQMAEGKHLRVGPRGGKRWLPRFFVRRVAWHVLDHAWEIEDRIV